MWPDSERPWYGTFVQTQADSLSALGVDVDVLAIRGYVSNWEYARGCARSARLNASWPGYDLVHAHYGHSGIVGRLQFRAPLVLSYCGDDLLGTLDERGVKTRRSRAEVAVFRQIARGCVRTITKSEQMQEQLPRARRSRNHVIPNGVNRAAFGPRDQAEARRRLGWAQDEKIVLFAGNPGVASKNHPLAVETCELLSRRVPEARLRVAWGLAPDQMPLAM